MGKKTCSKCGKSFKLTKTQKMLKKMIMGIMIIPTIKVPSLVKEAYKEAKNCCMVCLKEIMEPFIKEYEIDLKFLGL